MADTPLSFLIGKKLSSISIADGQTAIIFQDGSVINIFCNFAVSSKLLNLEVQDAELSKKNLCFLFSKSDLNICIDLHEFEHTEEIAVYKGNFGSELIVISKADLE
jgi:hypothetical protein